MARRTFDVIDVVEILQHWHACRSKSQIAASLDVDRGTVRKYVAPAEEAGLEPGGPPLTRDEWAELVGGWFPELVDAKSRSSTYPEINGHRDRIEEMLKTNTVTTVWQRLRDEHGLAAVRRAKPVAEILSRLTRDGGERMAYLFAPLQTPGRLLSRFFFPQGGAVIEDPATGSATANLGGWYLAMGRSLPQEFEISQGEYAGRPSTLFLQVGIDRAIRVSGEVIELGRGTITL